MPCVVIADCGRETRTAFVSPEDANGDARTEAAASIIAGFPVSGYILATGPIPDGDLSPTLWPFPLSKVLDLHTEIARFQRQLGRGHSSWRAAVFKAIKATTRTVTPDEIDAYLGAPLNPPPKRRRARVATPPAPGRPVQLSLF
jgi:hypothetical protein